MARTETGKVVGHLQAVPRDPTTWEVTNTVFTTQQGYPDGIEIDGIPLRDQIWFERIL